MVSGRWWVGWSVWSGFLLWHSEARGEGEFGGCLGKGTLVFGAGFLGRVWGGVGGGSDSLFVGEPTRERGRRRKNRLV